MAAVEQVGQARAASRRLSSHGLISQAAGYLAMVVVVFVIGLPLLWLLSAAFKESAEIYVVPATWIPSAPTLQLCRSVATPPSYRKLRRKPEQ